MYEDIVLGFEFEVEGRTDAIYDLIDNSAHITAHTDHYIDDYHDTRYKTAEGLWRVEEDETVAGAEFVSPLLKYNNARTVCKAFFEAIENTGGIETTHACGLHVGMSVNGTLDSVDLANIIPNINHRLLAKLWPDRMLGNHSYCNNLKNMLKKVNTFGTNELPVGIIKPNISSISKAWLGSTYGFIKIKCYDGVDYIEFRVPGGQDYHLKFDKLFTSIDHISDVLLGITKISKKKSAKKMYSYLNRIYKNVDYIYYPTPLIPEVFLENKLSTESFSIVYNLTIARLKHNPYENLPDKKKIRASLNKDNYLYCLLEYMVTNGMLSKLEKISGIINNTIVVSIPENKQQSDIIKMLKLWPILPHNLVRDLLTRLNQKAYNYFIKYYINNANNSEQRNWVFNVCRHELNNINPSF